MVVEISLAELFGQTVNVMEECIPVGVPVRAPGAVLKERPWIEVEISGETPQLSGAPPTLVGVAPLTRLFFVNVNGEPAYATSAYSCSTGSAPHDELALSALFAPPVTVMNE